MDTPVKLPVRGIGFGIIFLLIIMAMMGSYFTVEQYERGIVTTWGKFTYTADPGLHFKIPFVQDVSRMRVDIQSLSIAGDDKGSIRGVNTYTYDNQEVDVVFTVFYRLPPDKIEFIYSTARDYAGRLFQLAVDRTKAEMGRQKVEHLAQERGKVRDAIKATLVQDARMLGVEVTDFQLTDLQYTRSFRTAVEAAAAAKAMVETRDQERQQAEKVAQTAKIKAQGEADARLAQATAEAKAIELEGEAQAKAIKAQADALAQNARLVELRKAEKWDGKLPVQMLSGVVPFMNFQAPKE